MANVAASVTALKASKETPVRVISGRAYHFNSPDALVLSGDQPFVVNQNAASVTLLPVTP